MITRRLHPFAWLIAAACILPLAAPAAARADDDDWEDRWEDYEDRLEDAREEAEERWEDEREFRREYRDRGIRVHRDRYYYPYDGYRADVYPPQPYYGYHRGPVYRYYDGPRVYRRHHRHRTYYGGEVHAGPADVYYGRHGSVRVGPLYFAW